jgi:hypothetical protein
MIRLAVILLTSCILFACNSTHPKPNAPVASNVINFKTLDTSVPFAGFWVNETYVKNIGRTKSPGKCQGISESGLTIPGRTLQSTCMIYGFHEGGPEIVLVKKGNTYQFYSKDGDTISNSVYDIQVIAADKLKIGKNTFIKTNEKFLADILFSGEYRDSLNNTVQFSKDGHIKGLGNYAVYDPWYDYTGEPELDADQVDLGQDSINMEHFGYRFRQDTLLIYNLNCLEYDSLEHSCLHLALGDIKCKLVRIH